MALDEAKLNEFLGRFVSDLGATVAAGNVVIGHRLGLFRALAQGPATAEQLAARTETEPALRRGVAARPGGRRLRPVRRRQRHLLDDRGAGVRARQSGWRGLRAGRVRAGARRAEGERPDHRRVLAPATAWAGTSTTRTSSSAASSSSGPDTSRTWCRPGSRRWTASSASWRQAARAPTSAAGSVPRPCCSARRTRRSAFTGSDYHERSIELARKRAADAGVADRVQFEVAPAAGLLRIGLRPGHHLRLPARHG